MLDREQLKKFRNINNIADPKVRKKAKLDFLAKVKKVEDKAIRSDFLTFVKYIWPDFIEGFHHKDWRIKETHNQYAP